MATVAPVTLDVDTHLGAHGVDRVLIGINDRGQPAVWHRNITPHLRLTGDTGKGKSVAANTVIAHGVHHGDIVVHLDPKPGGARWVEPYAHVAVTPAGHSVALEWLVDEMVARQAVCWAAGVPDIHSLPTPLPRVTGVLEEMGSIVGDMAALPEPGEKPADATRRVEANLQRLALLATRGRSAGVHLVGITQYPSVEATFIGSARTGGAVNNQFGARLHLDAIDVALRMVFNKGDGIDDRTLKLIRAGKRGRGAYLHLDPADGGQPRTVQVWEIARLQLVALAANATRPHDSAYLAGRPPASFDIEAREYGPDDIQ